MNNDSLMISTAHTHTHTHMNGERESDKHRMRFNYTRANKLPKWRPRRRQRRISSSSIRTHSNRKHTYSILDTVFIFLPSFFVSSHLMWSNWIKFLCSTLIFTSLLLIFVVIAVFRRCFCCCCRCCRCLLLLLVSLSLLFYFGISLFDLLFVRFRFSAGPWCDSRILINVPRMYRCRCVRLQMCYFGRMSPREIAIWIEMAKLKKKSVWTRKENWKRTNVKC